MASRWPGPNIPYPYLKSGELLRAPNPYSSSSSSYFPACLLPILWPSQSRLPKITQCLGVLCPGRCCCLVWGQGASPEEDTGGRLVGVLASRSKTGNGWKTGRDRGCHWQWGRRKSLGCGGDSLHIRMIGIGEPEHLGIWLRIEPNPHPTLCLGAQSTISDHFKQI